MAGLQGRMDKDPQHVGHILQQIVAAAEKALGQLLDSKDTVAFEEYQVCQQELMLLTDKATFARGFQLGARLMLEIIEE